MKLNICSAIPQSRTHPPMIHPFQEENTLQNTHPPPQQPYPPQRMNQYILPLSHTPNHHLSSSKVATLNIQLFTRVIILYCNTSAHILFGCYAVVGFHGAQRGNFIIKILFSYTEIRSNCFNRSCSKDSAGKWHPIQYKLFVHVQSTPLCRLHFTPRIAL